MFWLRVGMCIDFSPWPNGGWAREDSVSCSSLSGTLVPNNSRTACSILMKWVCNWYSENSLQIEWYIPNIKNIMSNGRSWGWKIRFSKVRVICGACVGIIRAVLWLVTLTTLVGCPFYILCLRAVSPPRTALPSITTTYYCTTPESFPASAGDDSFFFHLDNFVDHFTFFTGLIFTRICFRCAGSFFVSGLALWQITRAVIFAGSGTWPPGTSRDFFNYGSCRTMDPLASGNLLHICHPPLPFFFFFFFSTTNNRKAFTFYCICIAWRSC